MSRNKKNRNKTVGAILLSSLFLLAGYFFFFSPLSEGLLSLFNSIIPSTDGLSFGINCDPERKGRKNLKLKERINALEIENNLLKRSLHEKEKLERVLKLKEERFPVTTVASVIARSPNSWDKELIIDKGRIHGLEPGMVAVTEKGILGQISEPKESYSVVRLMGSSQVRFGAEVERSKVKGVLLGAPENGKAILRFVPIGSDVQKGDMILTTDLSIDGLRNLFPRSYPVGQVIKAESNDNNSEMIIIVSLFESGANVDKVLILK